MVNKNEFISFSELVKFFLHSEIKPELESHLDELSSTIFWAKFNMLEATAEFYFKDTISTSNLNNIDNADICKTVIYETFFKEGVGIKFYQTENLCKCFCYILS